MVKSRIKTKIMAAATSLIMSFSIAFGGYDMSNVSANEGPEYTKYTFATGQTETYHLGEVPVSYNIPRMARTATTEREDANDISVVRITIYRYIDPSNPNAGYYTSSGTGTIIGDNEILTSAHLFYDSNGFRADADVVLPNSSVPTLAATSVHIPSEFMTNSGDADYDYAILTVPYYLTAYSSYYTLGIGTEQIMAKNPPIHSLGYEQGVLKLSHGNITYVDDYWYDFDLYSTGGSSGGPIYIETVVNTAGEIERYKTIIAIVEGPDNYDPNNQNPNYTGISSGTRITPEILRFAYDNEYL